MAKLLSLGKAAPSPPLASERELSLSKMSLGKCSPHCTASLAGEMRAPSLSQSFSQVCRRPGGSGGSSRHWRGEPWWPYYLLPLASQPPSLHCPLCPMPPGTEGGAWLQAPWPLWRGTVRRGTDRGVCCQLLWGSTDPERFCSPTTTRFLLANGTLPKWKGGEGCKPKLHC